MDIHLNNDYHHTQVRVRIESLPATLAPATTRYVKWALCGIKDCDCGSICGEQEVAVRWALRVGREVLVLERK